jgi:hypothetical protein
VTDLTAPILVGSTTVTIASTDTLSASSGSLVSFSGSATGGTLVNQGTMTETSASAAVAVTSSAEPDPQDIFENDGVFNVTGLTAIGVDYVTTHNNATFTVTGTGANAATQGADGDVVNSGSMTIQGAGPVNGVYDWNPSPGGVFQNLSGGTFSVSSSGGAATGVTLVYGYEFDNAGQITVSAATSGVGLTYGAFTHGNTIINSGSITVTGASSTGISVNTYYGVTPVSLTNSGTITAQVAIQYAGTSANLNNTGVLNGAVDLNGANDVVINTGTINGAVNLGNGNENLYSHTGAINGVITVGSGSSIITLGAENNTVDLAAGTHIVDAGGGANTVSYAGATSGVHVSLGLQGLAQSTGVGTDTLFNFQTLVGSSYNDTLEGGGSVSSTLTGGLGADTFVFAPGDGQVTVTDFSPGQGDVVDLSHEPGLQTLADVLAASSQQGADTVITFGSDTLRLQNVSVSSLTSTDFIYSDPTVGPTLGGLPITGNGLLTGTSGDDWLVGGSGNDTLHGGGGSDYLDGGGGLNTATYDGVYRQYVVAAGGTTVSGGPEGGTDILANIQRIQFVDGYVATSPTDTAGEVYRLYEGALGRVPDPEGLAGWVTALNNGTSLQAVADGFVGSAEFKATYGSLNNTAFITLLYENVLHRAADPNGLTGWLGYMAQGHSQSDVLLGFTESAEDIADLSTPVQHGLWVGDPNAAEVARLYDTTLERRPDLAGLTGWTQALDSGAASLLQVVQGFVNSAEFQADYGSLDNTAFVTQLYENALHRAPDPAGLTGWLNALNAGASRAQVVLGFSDSAEHIANMAPYIDNGIWLA